MAKVTWYGGPDETHRRVVRQPGMRAADYAKAQEIAAKANALLAVHHANNAENHTEGESVSYIDVSQGTVDAFVNLNDVDGGARGIEWKTSVLRRAAYG